ncbi:MAG: carboxypeptidase-like regulatory domain-containing protein [Bacteroidales bacterium]|nr:carboxypeptidase-like regulatory domain-containing protein [Bacteroidales bacterium]
MSEKSSSYKKWKRRLFAGWLLLQTLFLGQLHAQTLSGKVFSIDDKGDTVAVYMAQLQWLNTSVGTYTGMDGSYRISYTNTDTLIVRYLFYDPDTVIVNRKQRQRNFIISTSQPLQEVVISKKKKQRYTRKGNPAVELVQNVIKNKDRYRMEAADSYKAQQYKKMVMTFGRFDFDFYKNDFRQQFSFLEKYVDTIPEEEMPVLTLSLRESLADLYYQRSPRRNVTYVTARRMQGADEVLDEEGEGAGLEDIFTEVNIFDNDIELMLNKFVSPLSSSLATIYYHYFITDTVDVDGIPCIELSFSPVNSRTFGFSGRLYIVNDSTYALKRYAINVPVDINMNFVRQLRIEQDFVRLDTGLWVPNAAQTFASFSLTKRKKTKQIYIRQNTLWYNYEIGATMPDSLSAILSGGMADAPNTKYRSWQWKKMRPLPLTAKESFMDSLSTELRRLPAFKVLEKTAEILSTGYIATAKDRKESGFDIGSIYNMVSYNPTEGVRLRFGGMTTAKAHERWFLNWYVAFGLGDQRLKYKATLIHSFVKKERHYNEHPRHALSFSTMYDVEMPGQSYGYMERDNFLMSYSTGEPSLSAQYVQRLKLRYEKEWPFRLSLDTWVQYENNEATGTLMYWRINPDGGISRITSFQNLEWCMQLRWSPGERLYNNQSGNENIKLSKNAPVLRLTHTSGLLDLRYWYHRTDFSVEKRFWLSAFGHIDATLQAGIVWNTAPFPKLYIPPSNRSIFLASNAFCLMKPMEFIMDKYVSLYATYYLKGWIFNRIPLWNRLKFREVLSFSGVYGGLSAKNNPDSGTPGLYLFPDGCGQLGKLPYMEMTAGIENIFQFLRIDYVRRLTYAKDLKGWDKNGIRISLRVTF